MNERDTTSADFFERKYAVDVDPWKFATSDYEQFRYNAIIGSLGDRHYQHGFEPGCSIGELTVRLAPFCRRLTACEISPTAAARARERFRSRPNVAVVCEKLPDFLPQGPLDLIVLSEVGYYFDDQQLRLLGDRLAEQLTEDGVFVAAHWLGFSRDHKLSGDEVHDVLQNVSGLSHIEGNRYDKFRMDKWRKA